MTELGQLITKSFILEEKFRYPLGKKLLIGKFFTRKFEISDRKRRVVDDANYT